MTPETLYLAVNLLDRYLEKVEIDKKRLQLVSNDCNTPRKAVDH